MFWDLSRSKSSWSMSFCDSVYNFIQVLLSFLRFDISILKFFLQKASDFQFLYHALCGYFVLRLNRLLHVENLEVFHESLQIFEIDFMFTKLVELL